MCVKQYLFVYFSLYLHPSLFLHLPPLPLGNIPKLPVDGVHIAMTHIRALIGKFNLDPNRCIDLILEVYENNPDVKGFHFLLKEFKQK